MSIITPEIVEEFKAAWHEADERGMTGQRVEYALKAVESALTGRNVDGYAHLAYARDITRAWDDGTPLVHGCGYEKAPPPEDEFDAQPVRPLCPFCIRASIYYGTGRVPEPEAPRPTAAEIREQAKQEQSERELIDEAAVLMAKSFWLRNNPPVEGGWASA